MTISLYLSHILNGCYVYKWLYIAQLYRIVDLLVNDIYKVMCSAFRHHCVASHVTKLCNSEHDVSIVIIENEICLFAIGFLIIVKSGGSVPYEGFKVAASYKCCLTALIRVQPACVYIWQSG